MPKSKAGVKIQYRDQKIPCPISGCERTFKSPQGLLGHLKFVHGQSPAVVAAGETQASGLSQIYPSGELAGAQVDVVSLAGSPKTTSELKKEVETLELEQRKARLLAGHAQPAKPLDIGQKLGFGELTPEVQNVLQARAFNAQQSANGQDETLKVLSIISQVKDIFGGQRNDGLDVLRELGFNLKDLISSSQSPKTNSDFTLGGVPLGNVSMTPEVVMALVRFQESKELLAAKAIENQSFRDQIAGFLNLLTKNENFSKILSGVIGDVSRSGAVAAQIDEQGVDMRGRVAMKPDDNGIPPKRKPKVEETESRFIRCINDECQQLIDVKGMAVGTELLCPSCKTSQVLAAPDSPLPPLAVPSDEDKEAMMKYNQVWNSSKGDWVSAYE